MELKRRSFLAMALAPWLRPFLPALPAAAPLRCLGASGIEFIRISQTRIVPGGGPVLDRGDYLALAWFDDRGGRRAALLIRRAGESRVYITP